MSNKISERLSFSTDILTSYSGREQRIKCRQYPRYFYTYHYDAMNVTEAQWLRAVMRSQKNDIFLVPMWHNITNLSRNFLGGKELPIDKDATYNFLNCPDIMLFLHDDITSNDINIKRSVVSVDEGIIRLKKNISNSYHYRGGWIIPLKLCRVHDPYRSDYVFSNGTSTDVCFEDILNRTSFSIPDNVINDFQDEQYYNKYNLPLTFNDRPVLTILPQWVDDSDNSLSINKNINTLDNNTGMLLYDMKNSKSYDNQTFRITLLNKCAINNMHRFFINVSGRYKSFYFPSWANDIEITSDFEPDGNYVYAKVDLHKFYEKNTRRKFIVILYKSFISKILEIDHLESIERYKKTYGKIYFKEKLKWRIPKDYVKMVSLFNLVRFGSDEITFDYESTQVANTTLQLQEVDDLELL